MEKFTLSSLQAPNQDCIAAELASYLSVKLGFHCEFIADPTWQEREHMLLSGQIEMAWICGLPYVLMINQGNVPIELLAAPVMRDKRYLGKPVYYSDVVVRRESSFKSFGDLRGGMWAYNEPNSHSGYNLTRYMLAQMGEEKGFFGNVREAGSHQAALQMVLDGKIDGTSIDSTVLEMELENRPEISKQIRTIATWGPSPIPPWVIRKDVPAKMRARIRKALLNMESDLEGKAALARMGVQRFTRVSDADYDPIREMAQEAQRVRFGNR